MSGNTTCRDFPVISQRSRKLWYGSVHIVGKVLSSSLAATPRLEAGMPKSILIVDNSEAVRLSTRHFIEHNTIFEVCGEAADGLNAVEKTRDLRPDLIILDVEMPLQAVLEIRKISAAPIILFTFYADAIAVLDTSAFGINAVVSKVAEMGLLAAHIQRLMSQTGEPSKVA